MLQGRTGAGIHAFLGVLTIGRWRWWRDSYSHCKGRGVINLEDKMRWKKAKDGNFSVKSFYRAMEGSSTIPFPKSIIWSPCVPTKVNFFAWEAT